MYNIDRVLEDALRKRVWLNSGAYLVVEPTEALTVIDVNTGKAINKKDMRTHIYSINREAAAEAARQIRL
ncbi:MAG: ribonuclease E/G, partial [Lachnospiraceae bacterium]|nr:ribonuclease E/G [Lachnospiraceae bacterium]